MKNEEHWLPIHDFDGYEISNHGKVRRILKTGLYKILKMRRRSENECCRILISNREKLSDMNVAKLVLTHFSALEKIDEDDRIVHIDGDKSNNSIENLTLKKFVEKKWIPPFDAQRMRKVEISELEEALIRLLRSQVGTRKRKIGFLDKIQIFYNQENSVSEMKKHFKCSRQLIHQIRRDPKIY